MRWTTPVLNYVRQDEFHEVEVEGYNCIYYCTDTVHNFNKTLKKLLHPRGTRPRLLQKQYITN